MAGRLTSPRTLAVGSLNVRGCSSIESKRSEIGCMFGRRGMDVLALCETKMKGKEVAFGEVTGRVSGVERGRASEGVGLLLSEWMENKVVEWKEVSSRLMWVRVRMGRECWAFVSAYGPGCERSEEERDEFWNDLTRCVDGLTTRNCARLNVMLNGEALEEVDQFKYLGSVIAANGGVEADVRHRVNEGCKVLGALKGVMKNRGLGMNVKKVLYEKVAVPTVMYGSESWGMKVTERQKLNVFEMKCLRSMIGVSRLDRVRNEVVRARTGVRRELAARVDVNVLRWFGHVERMDNERLLKKVMNAKVDGRSARGRPRFG